MAKEIHRPTPLFLSMWVGSDYLVKCLNFELECNSGLTFPCSEVFKDAVIEKARLRGCGQGHPNSMTWRLLTQSHARLSHTLEAELD